MYDHTTKPAISPASAPRRVPPFQKMPPRAAGANCATAANEIGPIETSRSLACQAEVQIVVEGSIRSRRAGSPAGDP